MRGLMTDSEIHSKEKRRSAERERKSERKAQVNDTQEEL